MLMQHVLRCDVDNVQAVLNMISEEGTKNIFIEK